jgi:type IV secretory pathway VirB4 component
MRFNQPLKLNEDEVIIDFSGIDHQKQISDLNTKFDTLLATINRKSSRNSPAEYVREFGQKQDKVACDCDELKKRLTDLEAQNKDSASEHIILLKELKSEVKSTIKDGQSCLSWLRVEANAWLKTCLVLITVAGSAGVTIWAVKG